MAIQKIEPVKKKTGTQQYKERNRRPSIHLCKVGTFTIGKSLVAMLGEEKPVLSFCQDDETFDWYIMKDVEGIAFRPCKTKGPMIGNYRAMVRTIVESLRDDPFSEFTSVSFPVGPAVEIEGVTYWPIIDGAGKWNMKNED